MDGFRNPSWQTPEEAFRVFAARRARFVGVVVHNWNDRCVYSAAKRAAILPATSGETSISSFSDSQ